MAYEQGFGNIQERARFGQPVIRFRKIKGRIVPIINKHRAGKELESAGNSLIKGGLALGAVSVAKRTKTYSKASKAVKRATNKIKKNPFAFRNVGGKKTLYTKVMKGAGKAAKGTFKHSGKLSMAALLGGAAIKIYGFGMQTETQFGRDIGGKSE